MAKKETVEVVVPDNSQFYTCEVTGQRVHGSRVHSHITGVYHWNSEQGYQGVSLNQHFASTNEHSKDLHHTEIDEGTDRIANAPWIDMALPAGLPKRCCLSSCGKALTDDFWQVAPTYACRGHESLEAHAYWDLPKYGGQQVWFCSLDHAVQAAHIMVEELDDLGYAEPEQEVVRVIEAGGLKLIPPAGR